MKKITAVLLAFCMVILLLPVYSSAASVAQKLSSPKIMPTFSINKLGGGTVSNSDIKGKTTVFILGKLDKNRTCPNTVSIISNLCKELTGLENVKFYAVDLTQSSETDVAGFMSQYDPNGYMTACCGASGVNFFSLMCRTVGKSGSVYLPFVIFVDDTGYVQYYQTGCTSECCKQTLKEMSGEIIGTDKLKLSISGEQSYAKAEEALIYINQNRAEAGLEPLIMDAEMVAAAEQRAAETAILWEHTRPDDSGFYAVIPDGFNMGCGENILWTNDTLAAPETAVISWMNSPGHRANILTAAYQTTGLACFTHNGNVYWVQEFSIEELHTAGCGTNGNKKYTLLASPENAELKLNIAVPQEFCVGDTVEFSIESKNAGLSSHGVKTVYDLSGVTVSGGGVVVSVSGKTITALAPGEATLSFTVPYERSGGITLSIKLTVLQKTDPDNPDNPDDPDEPIMLPFTDVTETWYLDDVRYVYENGIMTGTSDTTFAPDETMTRAMFTMLLYKMEGQPSVIGSNPFSDVKKGEWYEKSVLWAYKNGLVNGVGGGRFDPEATITREQMATLLFRYAKWKNYDTSKTKSLAAFSDSGKISDYAYEGLSWMYAEGLINGVGNNLIDPGGNALRSHVAALTHRFVVKFTEK